MDAKDVTPEMHDEFYRFIGTSYDRPRFTLHYKTDAPLTLRALLYFPEGKPGMQKRVTGFSCTDHSDFCCHYSPSRKLCPQNLSDRRTADIFGSNNAQPKILIACLSRVGQ
jgi:hypothetical protein